MKSEWGLAPRPQVTDNILAESEIWVLTNLTSHRQDRWTKWSWSKPGGAQQGWRQDLVLAATGRGFSLSYHGTGKRDHLNNFNRILTSWNFKQKNCLGCLLHSYLCQSIKVQDWPSCQSDCMPLQILVFSEKNFFNQGHRNQCMALCRRHSAIQTCPLQLQTRLVAAL